MDKIKLFEAMTDSFNMLHNYTGKCITFIIQWTGQRTYAMSYTDKATDQPLLRHITDDTLALDC